MICNLDLHTHLLYKKQSPRKYWNYVIANNLLGTAITEYNFKKPEKAYQDLLEKKPKEKILIPGIKIKTDSGEVLIFSDSKELYDYSMLYEQETSLKRLIDFCDRKNYLITIAHPFGLITNSATYILGLSKLEKIVSSKNIGVEAYTGIIGYLSYYMYDSFFIRKLRQLLDFLELHRMFRSIGISSLSENLTQKIDQKSYDVVYKFSAAIKLGKKAKYITAGSGSFYVDSIGSGITTLDINKEYLKKPDQEINKYLLDKIKKKDIKAVGPPGYFDEELFIRSTARKTKRKAYNDLNYLTKNSVK